MVVCEKLNNPAFDLIVALIVGHCKGLNVNGNHSECNQTQLRLGCTGSHNQP